MRSPSPVGRYAALGEMLTPKALGPYPPDGGMGGAARLCPQSRTDGGAPDPLVIDYIECFALDLAGFACNIAIVAILCAHHDESRIESWASKICAHSTASCAAFARLPAIFIST